MYVGLMKRLTIRMRPGERHHKLELRIWRVKYLHFGAKRVGAKVGVVHVDLQRKHPEQER